MLIEPFLTLKASQVMERLGHISSSKPLNALQETELIGSSVTPNNNKTTQQSWADCN